MSPEYRFLIAFVVLRVLKKEHHVAHHLDVLSGHNKLTLSRLYLVWNLNDRLV